MHRLEGADPGTGCITHAAASEDVQASHPPIASRKSGVASARWLAFLRIPGIPSAGRGHGLAVLRSVVYLHDMPTHASPARRMIETCACHRIRMAARSVTRAYDEALRPIGLRATQASVLAAIAAEGAMSITALARVIGMDRSTLTRNLAPLEKEGLLSLGSEGWRRSRTLAITAKGRSRLEKAMPLWEEAQRRLRREIGARQWDDVQQSLDHLIRGSAPPRSRAPEV